MKYTKIKLTLLFNLLAFIAYSQQVQLKFINEETNGPIVGMAVYIKALNGVKNSGITDSDGLLTIDKIKMPFEIETRHINFKKQQYTISDTNDLTFKLKPKVTQMDDIVIGGDPYKNVSIDRDMYVVDEISRTEIEQLGGNNLGDVLNYHMNISVTPDPATGRSTVSMFGLTGEYVKILIDNVPVVSDNGVGNNIDITQIGLENVERIEVAEGSMGVLYGSNAVAGVINIITKKGGKSNWNIKTSLQEETIGQEYAWFNQGRHIQNISVSKKSFDHLFTSIGFRRNDFVGFFNGYEGKDHTVSSSGTAKGRGYEWNPKDQFSINSLVNYQLSDNIGIFYKYDYYDEKLDIYDKQVVSGEGLAKMEYTATDELYTTKRQSHQLNIDGDLFQKANFNFLVSYQNQERKYEDYTYNIGRGIKSATTGLVTNQTSKVYFSKGMINLPASDKFLVLTVGYEYEHQKGYDAIASGRQSDNIATQTLEYKDIFSSFRFFPKSKINLTPGFRFNINSRYNNHLIWSVVANAKLAENINTKFVLGSAYKTPNYTQLFYYFVDSNHNFTGNPDLKPEDGISILWTTTNESKFGSLVLRNSLKAYYFNIQDKITFSSIVEKRSDSPTDITRYTYLNVNEYNSAGLSFDNTISHKKLQINVGAEYLGINQSMEKLEDNGYLFRWNASSQVAYEIPKIAVKLSWKLKYNGGGERYFDNGSSVYKAKVDGFAMMDASLGKSMLNRALRGILGVRNLMDMVSVNISGAPPGYPTSQLFAYGRSFYFKLEYSLNLN